MARKLQVGRHMTISKHYVLMEWLMIKFSKIVLLIGSLFILNGCTETLTYLNEKMSPANAMNEPLPNTPTVEQRIQQIDLPESGQDVIKATEEVLTASIDNVPTITSVGYAVVSSQAGRTEAQKRLMAIRAARMAAMRDLAEQIHGMKVDSNTTVIDLVMQNDTFRGRVTGTIRGARTVRINPTGSDTYETVLEIDQDMVAYLFRQAQSL